MLFFLDMMTDFHTQNYQFRCPTVIKESLFDLGCLLPAVSEILTEVTFIRQWWQNCLHIVIIWFSALLPISTPSGISAPLPLFYVRKLDRWWCFAKTSLVISCLHNWSLLLHVLLLFLSLSLFLYWPLSSKGSNLDFKTAMDILVCWCEYRID